MEKDYENMHYKSGWRPLSKENNVGNEIPFEAFEERVSFESFEKKKQGSENNKNPNNNSEINQNVILEKLTTISAEIEMLNQKILNLNGKIDSLLSIFTENNTLAKDLPLGKQKNDSKYNLRFFDIFHKPVR